MTIRFARQMPEARSRLLRWLEGRSDTAGFEAEYGVQSSPAVLMAKSAGMPGFLADLPEDHRGAAYADWVANKLRAAELYFVSSDMAELAEHAAGSLPTHNVHPQMLPSDIGLVCWPEPITGSDSRFVIACMWVAIPEGIWVSTWVDPIHSVYRALNEAAPFSEIPEPAAVDAFAAQYGSIIGWLGPDEEVVMPWARPWVWTDPSPARSRAISTLTAAWLLMGQTLTMSEQQQPRPADRRRFARRGDPEATVTYVALRRRQTIRESSEPTENSRQHHHRWLVSGHWRNQYYPSADERRPIWIAPHIKGPEDAPLLHSEHVYTLRR